MSLPSPDLADLLKAMMDGEDRNVADAVSVPIYLADFAKSLGESPVAVERELRRNTALTRLLKKALQVEAYPPDHSKAKGRPRKDAQHWRDREAVRLFRELGATVDQAYACAAQLRNAEGRRGSNGKKITKEGIRSAVERLPTMTLGDLFVPLPMAERDDLLASLAEGPKDDWKKWNIEL